MNGRRIGKKGAKVQRIRWIRHDDDYCDDYYFTPLFRVSVCDCGRIKNKSRLLVLRYEFGDSRAERLLELLLGVGQ